MLKDTERLDDLEYNNLKIIQDKTGYCFTSDAVLLANSVQTHTKAKVLELGSGSGVISILVSAKNNPKLVVGVEVQPRLAEMSERSIIFNRLDDKIKIINVNLKDIFLHIPKASFDVVVTNPPYARHSEVAEITEKTICKAETTVSIEDWIKISAESLRFGGKLYIINKVDRLVDMVCAMRINNLEPKEIRIIQPKPNKDIDTVIIIAKKGAKSGLKMPKPLIVYNDDGEYTEEAKVIYGK